ncbi:MAG: Holliday junction resolvase [Bacillota bacterium]
MTRLNKLPDGVDESRVKSSIGGNYELKANSEKVYKKKNDGQAKLVIPGELPTMNRIINESKTHWSNYKKMKETFDDTVVFFAEKQEIPFFKSVKLNITYYRSDKRVDPDNIVAGKKFIIDGLVEAGVLEEDGWKQIKGFKETWEKNKENPRTEIILQEVK